MLPSGFLFCWFHLTSLGGQRPALQGAAATGIGTPRAWLAWCGAAFQDGAMGETLLDVKGMTCPLPVLRANRVLRGMQPGDKLRVLATDRASVPDFRAFCRETGHDLVAFGEEAGVFSFTIRCRAETGS
jgi:tRNA 2-thiouridine synthesizing protein A